MNNNIVKAIKNEEIFWYDGYKFNKTFWTPYTDHNSRIGESFKVIRRATTKDVDEECLPIWLIKFEDGKEIFAYPEEIISEEIENVKKQVGIGWSRVSK